MPFYTRRSASARLPSQSGIAIGMILFVVAILAVLAIAMSAGGNFMGTTVVPDRINADVKSQGNLIRAKILECYTFGFDRGDLLDKYPSSTGTGTLVSALDCPSYKSGQTNLWTGQSAASLPAPTANFGAWYYVNAAATGGGRCIRIQPNSNVATDAGVKAGLAQVVLAFTSLEVTYDPASTSQRFIMWITRPTGTAATDCTP